MSGETVRFVGLKSTIRQLKALDVAIVPVIKRMHLEAAEKVAVTARARAPRRSGRLAGSIRPSGTQTGAAVRAGGARVPYAGPIHFGWRARNIEPNPFLYDALDARRDTTIAAYERQLRALVERTIRGGGD